MIRTMARLSMTIAILLAFIPSAFAETRTISWAPVTSYTDGTPIEAGKTVSYSAYWTTDPGLGSLVTIGASLTTTSTTFDPTVQGMTRGGTVYFTAKSVLNTGEVSSLSPAFAWIVPLATPPPAVLGSISISGPSSVNEGATGTYTATGTWDNGTTAAISPTWSENSSYATIGAGGLLTASTVTSNQAVTVTASYGGKTGTKSLTIVNATAVLASVAVSGPSSVNEGGAVTYTATGTYDDGTTSAISPTWTENSSYATIGAGGLLTASTVTSNQAVTVTAGYGGKTGTMSVTIVNAAAVLTGVAVSGPSSVNEGATGTYTATGTWDNGTTTAVSPTWSENSSYATIGTGGLLSASAVTSNQAVTVTAGYGGKTGTLSVTIVDNQGLAPSAPKNIGIAGSTAFVSSPSVSAPPVAAEIWRVSWETVLTNWNGTPIDPARTVRYTAYWTDDPALSAASLRTLASSISGTVVDFDPSANGMTKNQVVYFTARAILDTGEQSSLATSLTWRVENTGPVPPAKGKIVKK
jgi:hypothetical protein